jgi:hypothetical protein
MPNTLTESGRIANQLYLQSRSQTATQLPTASRRGFDVLFRLARSAWRTGERLAELCAATFVLIIFTPVVIVAWLANLAEKRSTPGQRKTDRTVSREQQQAWISEMEDFDRF